MTKLARVRIAQQRLADAETLARSALGVLRADPRSDPVQIAEAQRALASAISFGKGAPPEAVALLEEAVKRFEQASGPDDEKTLACLYFLAQTWSQSRDDAKAVAVLGEVIARAEKRYGKNSVVLANPLDALALVTARDGKPDEADALYRRAIGILREQGPARAEGLPHLLSHRATLLRDQRRLHEAVGVFAEADMAVPAGDMNIRPDILRGKGRVELLLGQTDDAERDLRQAYEMRRKAIGDENGLTWYFAGEWGRALAAQKRYVEAEKIQRQALDRLAAIMGPTAYQNALMLDVLATTLELQPGRREEAESLRRRELQIVEGKYPKTHALWALHASYLAQNLADSTSPAAKSEALELGAQALAVCRANAGDREPLAEMLSLQARLLADVGRHQESAALARESVDVFAGITDPDAASLQQAKALLTQTP